MADIQGFNWDWSQALIEIEFSEYPKFLLIDCQDDTGSRVSTVYTLYGVVFEEVSLKTDFLFFNKYVTKSEPKWQSWIQPSHAFSTIYMPKGILFMIMV